MRWRRAFLATLLTCGVAQVGACDFAAGAATFPVSTLTFETRTISFEIRPLAFPSELVRTETAATIEVTLPADVLFDFDKSDIRADAQDALHEVAKLLREKARGPVTIQGYTDALGNDDYNQRLSERRAAAVKTWLITREALASMSFTTSGFGARNPVAPNRKPDGSDNPEGRQLNRRVTLIFHK